MINVTKTYLPSFEKYTRTLQRAWNKGWVTNNGELVQELEQRLKEYLGVKHFFYCTNGTVALQLALKAGGITGEVITTPFSYVATANAILWEGCTPVFVDIKEEDCCIDAGKIEAAITKNTQAIVATHVYGNACAVGEIEAIAARHQLKVIYDGAHAFGCVYNGKSLLSYGDITTCSFHATKTFHTVEGGCIITADDELAKKIRLFRQFGHIKDDYESIGINGKNSELHAAMGLCMLDDVPAILQSRKQVCDEYDEVLKGAGLQHPVTLNSDGAHSYNYYPVIFPSEKKLLQAMENLQTAGIYPRRYFYPALNTLPFIKGTPCPLAEDIAPRVLCLPLYDGLTNEEINNIAGIINGLTDKQVNG